MIDDEPLMLTALRRLLARRYEVVVLENVDLALLVLTSGQCFDAILCDVNMPGMPGPEIREVLDKLGSPMAGRFIWMSGASCPVEGPFIEKPFVLADLERMLALVADLPLATPEMHQVPVCFREANANCASSQRSGFSGCRACAPLPTVAMSA